MKAPLALLRTSAAPSRQNDRPHERFSGSAHKPNNARGGDGSQGNARSQRVVSLLALLLPFTIAIPLRTGKAVTTTADADQLVREVISNETQSQVNDHNLWSYRELTKRKGEEVLIEYYQTKNGTIHRLLAEDGHPLNPEQRRAEDQRIERLIRSPSALQAAQRKEGADAEEERKFLRLFPEAFGYQEENLQGDLMTLRFTPNPHFHPSGNEQRVLHSLAGTMVVNVKQKRLASVHGRLMTPVKFWGGFLGHLDQGGTFSVVSENVAPGDWELRSLDIEMSGKALLFRTITVHEQDTYSDYAPVPPGLTLAQAAERLQEGSRGRT